MPVEYTVNVNAITTPPIIAVEVTAGCGGGSTKEEVLVAATEPTVDWTDGLWADTSTIYPPGTATQGEVVVEATEPSGSFEIWADTSVVSPVTTNQIDVLMSHIKSLELRITELEGQHGD